MILLELFFRGHGAASSSSRLQSPPSLILLLPSLRLLHHARWRQQLQGPSMNYPSEISTPARDRKTTRTYPDRELSYNHRSCSFLQPPLLPSSLPVCFVPFPLPSFLSSSHPPWRVSIRGQWSARMGNI
eukprot:753945-Hanusia_phi.AAC.4